MPYADFFRRSSRPPTRAQRAGTRVLESSEQRGAAAAGAQASATASKRHVPGARRARGERVQDGVRLLDFTCSSAVLELYASALRRVAGRDLCDRITLCRVRCRFILRISETVPPIEATSSWAINSTIIPTFLGGLGRHLLNPDADPSPNCIVPGKTFNKQLGKARNSLAIGPASP